MYETAALHGTHITCVLVYVPVAAEWLRYKRSKLLSVMPSIPPGYYNTEDTEPKGVCVLVLARVLSELLSVTLRCTLARSRFGGGLLDASKCVRPSTSTSCTRLAK